MVFSVQDYLQQHGPCRSSRVAEAMVASGITPQAARQRLARLGLPIRRFPVPMLPKREAFLYLEKDRNTERFWVNFLRDLRETGSVFASAIDGMVARGGAVKSNQFPVISGAPIIHQKGQLSASIVAQRLQAANFITEKYDEEVGAYYALPFSLSEGGLSALPARDLIERVLLDGVREWARKIGLASYNTIRIRGDAELKPIGPFAFDLAGPSYLLPLQGPGTRPGFLVADVFAEGMLGEAEVQYFIRKARMLRSTLTGVGVLSIIVAEAFTGAALKAGHAGGVMLATPKDLFGRRVGAAIASLLEVLKNAAAYASSSPERLTALLDSLFDIEGRSNNLRGVLFELIAAYLARRDAVSIDMNVRAKDMSTGKVAEIDIVKVLHQSSAVTAIECKGKEPGGVLTRAEVETWLGKLPTIRAYFKAHPSFYEAQHCFEIWTSGTIAADALALLEEEKIKRVKAPIDWKDGEAVLALAHAGKEKGIADALRQHYLAHPFAEIAKKLAEDSAKSNAKLGSNSAAPYTPATAPVSTGVLFPSLPALPTLDDHLQE